MGKSACELYDERKKQKAKLRREKKMREQPLLAKKQAIAKMTAPQVIPQQVLGTTQAVYTPKLAAFQPAQQVLQRPQGAAMGIVQSLLGGLVQYGLQRRFEKQQTQLETNRLQQQQDLQNQRIEAENEQATMANAVAARRELGRFGQETQLQQNQLRAQRQLQADQQAFQQAQQRGTQQLQQQQQAHEREMEERRMAFQERMLNLQQQQQVNLNANQAPHMQMPIPQRPVEQPARAEFGSYVNEADIERVAQENRPGRLWGEFPEEEKKQEQAPPPFYFRPNLVVAGGSKAAIRNPPVKAQNVIQKSLSLQNETYQQRLERLTGAKLQTTPELKRKMDIEKKINEAVMSYTPAIEKSESDQKIQTTVIANTAAKSRQQELSSSPGFNLLPSQLQFDENVSQQALQQTMNSFIPPKPIEFRNINEMSNEELGKELYTVSDPERRMQLQQTIRNRVKEIQQQKQKQTIDVISRLGKLKRAFDIANPQRQAFRTLKQYKPEVTNIRDSLYVEPEEDYETSLSFPYKTLKDTGDNIKKLQLLKAKLADEQESSGWPLEEEFQSLNIPFKQPKPMTEPSQFYDSMQQLYSQNEEKENRPSFTPLNETNEMDQSIARMTTPAKMNQYPSMSDIHSAMRHGRPEEAKENIARIIGNPNQQISASIPIDEEKTNEIKAGLLQRKKVRNMRSILYEAEGRQERFDEEQKSSKEQEPIELKNIRKIEYSSKPPIFQDKLSFDNENKRRPDRGPTIKSIMNKTFGKDAFAALGYLNDEDVSYIKSARTLEAAQKYIWDALRKKRGIYEKKL